ncbi:AraC family transcriptional regulator [Halopseudomonas pelagia]|uniref:AraC family transcriptional regulator n=1 Tax=Halopseudomonas pelagia TaxID=553151 RepID=A0AA91U0V2_9GAMM|nr:AraC family transcriptional regulator [Halopseudomonas pelagia]PCC98331.1 AraC family transcriptional regulator [Halopseudomonas pelagia]QFY56656.1 AraC family transcriptional regulator [Halopseudomonas pelagia]
MSTRNWIDLKQDADTGIETIRAHFEGHAYDPHWHDSYLVGFTEQGVQRFHCGRQLYDSVPGKVILLEPGEIHDGEAPTTDGFTYSMLYLDPRWLEQELRSLFGDAPEDCVPAMSMTVAQSPKLIFAIASTFQTLHQQELRIVRQTALDYLLTQLTSQMHWRRRTETDPRMPQVARQARDYLHSHLQDDVSLTDLASLTGVDRFRLNRAFKAAFGLAPHAYLVQLRLAQARRKLAAGESPALVAAGLGFADQSHLGRWFKRAYGLTPAAYQQRCTHLPDGR